MDETAAEVLEDPAADEQSIAMDDATPSNSSATAVEGIADGPKICCQDCGEAFKEEAGYLEHRNQHPDGSCLMYLEPVEDLDDADKDGESTSYCNFCSQSFGDLSEFRLHMENHRSQPLDTQPISGAAKPTFQCEECGKSYFMFGHYLNHQRSHIQASKSLFKDLEQLKKKSFQCESCGRSYSRQSALDAHRRCHEGKLIKSRNRTSEEFIPPVETAGEAKPVENQTYAIPEKLISCTCGKAFSSLNGLKTHQRFSHSLQCSKIEIKVKQKKNVYNCKDCKKIFHGHLAWFNHEKWHENRAEGSANRFPCETCGKVFMTQTFYFRHLRTVHSEAPAKSFLHQVGQVQKRALECKDCGLKFSRPSAFHSHQRQHTKDFKETEGLADKQKPLVQQQIALHGEPILRYQADAQNVLRLKSDDDPLVNEEDMESYEPGDFNVLVISASESEEETVQDSHFELDSEADQLAKDLAETVPAPNQPELGLKIVQVDLESGKEQRPTTEAENTVVAERIDCPDCYRWFTSESSLRAHLMWHNVHERRRKKGQSVEVYTCDNEANSYAAGYTTIERKQELSQLEQLNCVTCDNCGVYFVCSSAHIVDQPNRKQWLCQDCVTSSSQKASLVSHTMNHSARRKQNISVIKVYNPKKTLLGPKIHHCKQCGKGFWSLGAYSHHKQNPSQCVDVRLRTGIAQPMHRGRSRTSNKVTCTVCGRKFRHKGIMTLHMRIHENGNHKCDICNRSFRLLSSLLRHQVVHNEHLPPPTKSFQHQVEQLQKNTYSCTECGKLFSRAKALKFHMKYHGYESGHSPSPPRSSQEVIQCVLCLTYFKTKASLRAHQKICIKKECQTSNCQTERLNDNLMEESSVRLPHITVKKKEIDTEELHSESPNTTCHLETNSNLKYKCKKCDKSFSVVGALNLHNRIHAKGYKNKAYATLSSVRSEEELRKDFPFPCIECGKRFISNSALGSHKRWHSKEKFSNYWLQDHHMSTQHVNSPKSDTQCDLLCPERLLLSDDTGAQEGVTSLKSVNQVVLDDCEPTSMLTSKMHQCPLCSVSFSTPKGLCAHKLQAHPEIAKDTPKITVDAQTQASKVTISVVGEKNLGLDAPPLSSAVKVQCGLQCSTAVKDRKLRPEFKTEVQAPEALADISLPFSRLSEPTGKCLYKCGKCGKAFQTEGQLVSHKTRAKSRPFCCALCCNAFWTENQLQQHLTWHDQVRLRLPNEVRLRLSAALTSRSLKPADN